MCVLSTYVYIFICLSFHVAVTTTQPFIYPDEVGVPIGESSTYGMLEIHFNNPTHRKGMVVLLGA